MDGHNQAPREARLELLPRDEWEIKITGGYLIISAWANGEHAHHVRYTLSDPSDDRVNIDDVEGVFVGAVGKVLHYVRFEHPLDDPVTLENLEGDAVVYVHHVRLDPSNPSDDRIRMDDLVGGIVDVVDFEA